MSKIEGILYLGTFALLSLPNTVTGSTVKVKKGFHIHRLSAPVVEIIRPPTPTVKFMEPLLPQSESSRLVGWLETLEVLNGYGIFFADSLMGDTKNSK